MNTRTFITLCAVIVLLMPLTTAFGQDSNMIQPGTPEAAKVTATLKHRERHDREQASAYTGGADSDRGMFYQRKADEIKGLLAKLEQGQPISRDDVHHAMSNKHAVRYGND
jgi:hypothetical protein